MKTIACTLAAFAFISATGCSDSSQPAAMTAEGIEREAAESPEVPEAPAVTSDHGYVLDTTVESITGEPVDLNSYRGKVVLVVNTASQCGLTPQYEQLQELYEQHKDSGLVVLAFPSNDFNQERGSNEEIAEYCDARHQCVGTGLRDEADGAVEFTPPQPGKLSALGDLRIDEVGELSRAGQSRHGNRIIRVIGLAGMRWWAGRLLDDGGRRRAG